MHDGSAMKEKMKSLSEVRPSPPAPLHFHSSQSRRRRRRCVRRHSDRHSEICMKLTGRGKKKEQGSIHYQTCTTQRPPSASAAAAACMEKDGNGPSSCIQTCDPTVCISFSSVHKHTLSITPLSSTTRQLTGHTLVLWPLLADTRGSFRRSDDALSTRCASF
ncbi:uncharacterized protein V6R79_014416 [Siganus canaliculatus]